MSDYKWNNQVVQANQFVRQSYNNLKATEIKILDTLVSCIDTMHPKTKVEITKTELAKAIGMNSDPNYVYVAQSLKALLSETWAFTTDEYTELRHFLERVKWWHDDDKVEVEFHKDLIPMLIDLKTNFLTYNIGELNCLKSRYSMLLYKYILSYIRQYNTLELTITIEELRKFLNLKKKYLDFRNFDRRILQVFEKEVNESRSLPYLIRYEKKGGKKVNAIRFLVRARTSNNETSFMDIQNPIMTEELTNNLIKGNTPLAEIRNRQADQILEEQQQLF